MSFMKLNLPAASSAGSSASASAARSSLAHVVVSPLPLAEILDHYLRRVGQDRVFGTLLGHVQPSSGGPGAAGAGGEGSVFITNSFGIPYLVDVKNNATGDVQIDMDHHKALLELHLKVNPKEVVVGWYTTAPQLNSFSALIHNFYTTETAPAPALHLTLDPSTLEFKTYVASPIGTAVSGGGMSFLPVESVLRVAEGERGGIDLLTRNITALSLSAPRAATTGEALQTTSLAGPLENLVQLLTRVSEILDSVLLYVAQVNRGELPGDERVGRALLETVGPAQTPLPVTVGAGGAGEEEVKTFEEEFNAHLADVLMVSYLASVLKTQTEISSRLNLLV